MRCQRRVEHTAEAAQSRGPCPLLPGVRPPRRGHPLARRYALGFPATDPALTLNFEVVRSSHAPVIRI